MPPKESKTKKKTVRKKKVQEPENDSEPIIIDINNLDDLEPTDNKDKDNKDKDNKDNKDKDNKEGLPEYAEVVVDKASINDLTEDNEKYLMKLVIFRPGPIKKLFNSLSENLIDLTIKFFPDHIRIFEMNHTKTVTIDVKLDGKKFQEYYLHKNEPIRRGIRVKSINEEIKTIDNDNVLVFYIKKDTPKKINIIKNNAKKDITTDAPKKCIDLKVDNFKDIPDELYTSTISMPGTFLQKTLRENYNLSARVDIICHNSKIILTLKSPKNKDDDGRKTTIKNNPKNMYFTVNKKPSEIIQGVYSLKQLVSFTKCTDISPHNVKLYMGNGLPLQFEYQVGDLGRIKLYVAEDNT